MSLNTTVLIPSSGCADGPPPGIKSVRFDYIAKAITGNRIEPVPPCPPFYYGNFQADNVQINAALTVGTTINAGGTVSAPTFVGNFSGTINQQAWKGFDIKHPNKPNHRLRHICLEGPEGGVYFRGRLTNSNVIDLPDYWDGLIDPESITISLTQIGYAQDLIIDKIEWGKKVYIKSGNGSNIDCYYLINASRIDGEPLIVEYAGETPESYPGSSKQYSISGYNYDVREEN
jgi:hypothetical protein